MMKITNQHFTRPEMCIHTVVILFGPLKAILMTGCVISSFMEKEANNKSQGRGQAPGILSDKPKPNRGLHLFSHFESIRT